MQKNTSAAIRSNGSAGTSTEKALINAIGSKAANAAAAKVDSFRNTSNQAAQIEAQFDGFMQNLNSAIASGKWDEAQKTLSSAETFLATPGFQGNTLFTERKKIYEASLKALGGAIGAASGTSILDMQQQMAQVQQAAADAAAEASAANEEKAATLASAQETIDKQKAQLRSLTERLSTLTKQNSDQKSQISSLDGQVTKLTSQVTGLNTTVKQLQTSNNSKDEQINSLKTQAQQLINQQISNLQSASQALQGTEKSAGAGTDDAAKTGSSAKQ
jgi:uncharacterized coiled-coil protein SlyX